VHYLSLITHSKLVTTVISDLSRMSPDDSLFVHGVALCYTALTALYLWAFSVRSVDSRPTQSAKSLVFGFKCDRICKQRERNCSSFSSDCQSWRRIQYD